MDIRVTSDDAIFVERRHPRGRDRARPVGHRSCSLVIYLFLLDWRATLIPGLAMPVALIGTIAAIYLAGFSINILTLLALVLATGLVVDDAIVVLENIVRRRNEGMGPRAAAVLGTQEVFFAVIATTATLAAVFVPLSFLPGQTGGLFREFGFVLAISVLLSVGRGAVALPDARLAHADGARRRARTAASMGTARRRACRALPALPARLPQRAADRRAGVGAVRRRRLWRLRPDPPGTDAARGPLAW